MGQTKREQIARIIDPVAWEEYLLEDGRVDPEVASIFQEPYEDSLAKADQIIALSAEGELLEAARVIADQCEAEFTVDGMWSNEGQAITHVAYRNLRAAIKKESGN